MTATWRKRLPWPLRRVLHAVWPERWTQAELDECRRRARAKMRALGLEPEPWDENRA